MMMNPYPSKKTPKAPKTFPDPSILSRPENRMAERDWMPVFYVDGIMLVPHYTEKHTWVWPGGDTYTAAELEAMGARQTTTLLWPRYWLNKPEEISGIQT
jgi:hypothetical protein